MQQNHDKHSFTHANNWYTRVYAGVFSGTDWQFIELTIIITKFDYEMIIYGFSCKSDNTNIKEHPPN